MTYFNLVFLWSTLTIAIPIAIALWNRKQNRREDFGGFQLLRELLQSTQKRIRLLELLKLLNRILLISLLVFIFVEPLKKEVRLGGAEEGFAFILDVGRVMQLKNSSGKSLIELQKEKVAELLKKMPSLSQGVIFFLSDHCDSMRIDGHRLTATAEQWLNILSENQIPYVNAPTTSAAFSSCLSRVDGLFEKKEILKILISPLPNTLDEIQIKKAKIQIEALEAPELPTSAPVEVRQELESEKVRLIFSPQEKREARLIRQGKKATGEVENLGEVSGSLDLPASGDAWLWLKKASAIDPWHESLVTSIQKQTTYQVTVWAAKESPGYLSLISALRNYPEMKVVRQVGGEPSGGAVIVYGSFPYSLDILKRAWFFIDPSGQSPFKIRDQKQWSAGVTSADVRRAFHIQTEDGEIFVKKYALMDLDHFDILETFQDGAPSLLLDRGAINERRWISPFDLEDLTTDLTLEPTFIPYLYRHLETWLSFDPAGEDLSDLKPIWLMPGTSVPTKTVVSQERWPGVYGDGGRFRVIEPKTLPTGFLKLTETTGSRAATEETVSLRPILFKFLVASLFVELLLCLLSLQILGFLVLIFAMGPALQAEPVLRAVPIAYFKGIDSDRKLALEQILQEVSKNSNLDFAKPQEVNFNKIWENAMVFASSTRAFGPLTKDEREKVRDYCDRGGLLVFDDPLASADSTFYRSAKAELAEIFPGRPLKSVSKDDVLLRTFYLLSEVSGRKLASPYLEAVELDRRSVAVFSFNDLLGANMKSANGDFAFSVTPYGIQQRVLAKRLFLDFLMYSLTVDYKDDAIHLPHILKRRSR